MIEIAEEIDLACAPLRAVSCLEKCFVAVAAGEAKPVFVPAVKAYFSVTIEKPTTFKFTSHALADRTVIASTRLQWRPDAGGLLPEFDGSLNVHASGAAQGRCLLILRGLCTSTPGKSGKVLDPAFSREIASETARRVLERLRKTCESFAPVPDMGAEAAG